MKPIAEVLLPARLGKPFRWLISAAWSSNLGDGIAMAAGPLLIASLTSSPFLVASAALLQQLPWLLFGLWAGVLADRLDRRRIVMVANSLRVLVVIGLCAFIVHGSVNIAVVLVVMFLYGVAETFADTTKQTLLPALVPPEHLSVGAHRMQAAFLTMNNLAGPPLGALLFALGWVWPFFTQVALVALAVVLISRIASSAPPAGAPGLSAHQLAASSNAEGAERKVRDDVADGLRWVWNSPPVRTLALIILTFNFTWGAAWAVLVLWSRETLGMTEVQFGLLSTVTAIGGLLGTFLYRRIEKRFSASAMMKVCLTLEVTSHLVLGSTVSIPVAFITMFVFGCYAFIWGTISMTTRMRLVPPSLQGRVGSVNMICVIGGVVIGRALGGVIAETWGLRAPFWFAFVGSAITLALIWRELPKIAQAPDAIH